MELIRLADHNKKLKNTYAFDTNGKRFTVKQFLIFSLPAEKTCPNSTEQCRKSCYAKKAERMYEKTRIARERNYRTSLTQDFSARMIATIEYHMNRPNYKNTKFLFRIHESGDFYSVAYMKKWIDIAKHFENNNRISFCAYTKSIDFYTDVKNDIPNNLVIRASIWNDTTDIERDKIVKNDMPFFRTINKKEIDGIVKNETMFKCGGDCGKCNVCYTNYKRVAVGLH